ncbi:MAG: hypothetical protein C0622_12670 [Desulfuromonas sp.]|nr:MAG: hypothetical protein C0622_12670 [Desulfuromonas sp.]
MKENIAGRVGRIITSSVNALVDALENAAPVMVMEEAIREVDGVIDEVRTELGKGVAQKHLAEQRLADNRKRHTDLSQKAQVAIKEGRDDLAEAAIEQQMDIEAQIPILEKAVAEANKQHDELEGYISALQAKKREMQEELRRLRAAEAKASAPGGGEAAAADSKSYAAKAEKATSAFDRIMEKNTGLPKGGSGTDNAAKLAELEELARKNRIKERLAAMKASEE